MSANTEQESIERSVTLHDDEPIMVARMIQFMYCNEYSFPVWQVVVAECPSLEDMMNSGGPGVPARSLRPTVHDVRAPMYVLGDKYDIKTLVESSRVGLKEYVETDSDRFTYIVDIIGIGALQRDSELCRLMVGALAKNDSDIKVYFGQHAAALLSDIGISNIVIDCLIAAAQNKAADKRSKTKRGSMK
jgi:hypothetical protein